MRQVRRRSHHRNLWDVTIEPASNADIIVVLPATADCSASGAVCTADGRALLNRIEATIPGPWPVASIVAAGSPVTEGTAAAFAVTLNKPALEPLTVPVSVAESGSTVSGAALTSVIFGQGGTSATLTVPTEADTVVEADSTVTATVISGTGYSIGTASSASVTVEDDDVAAFTLLAEPAAIDEGETATLTVAISNGVTFASAQAISLEISGTASESDFTGFPATLTLAAGASSVTAALAASSDREEEEAETVTVTASHDGASIGSATVTIESVSRDATLSALSLTGIDIGTFSGAVTSYEASVGSGVATTTVTATATHSAATVTIEPGSEASLVEGANEISVTVTAEDGETTQAYTVTVTRAGPPLTASFVSLPDTHGGSGTVVLRVQFSEPVATSYVTLRDRSFAVANGRVRNARRVDGRSDLWEIEIAPSGGSDLVVVLPPTTDCELAGGVCTEDGRGLSNRLEATIPRAEPALPVVSVAAVASAVTEGEAADFRVTLSEPAGERLRVGLSWAIGDGAESTGYTHFPAGVTSKWPSYSKSDDQLVRGDLTVTLTLEAGEGYTVSEEARSASVVVQENDEAEFALSVDPAEVSEGESATVRVAIGNGVRFAHRQTIELDFAGSTARRGEDFTVSAESLRLGARAGLATATVRAVADGTAEAAETVAITARHGGAVIGSATITIAGSEASGLTAEFAGMPATHDGETAFAFELRFSEEIEISYVTLRDTAFEVTGGAVRGARRLARPSNRRWEITLQPASAVDMVVALPETADCTAAGAVCTAGGTRLSQRLEATVQGPSEVEAAGFPLARGNSRPSGIWSDGETAWVADLDDARLYAYRRADGDRQPDKDIATEAGPMGLWSDGETLWVAGVGGGLRAHRLADGTRQAWRDLALEANMAPAGVWSDGETAWVSEWLGDTVHAYGLADGRRVAQRDIRLAGGNLLPVGLWSDGETLWVADWRERMYAYRLSDGRRDPDKDILAGAADTDPSGLWAGAGILLSTGWESGQVRAYRLPVPLSPEPVSGKGSGVGLEARSASLPPIADPALRAAIRAALGKAPGEAASPHELAGLEALVARNAGIRELAGLERASGLKELDLGFNPLEALRPLEGLRRLVSLNLDGAAPDLQPLASLTNLRRLSVRHNGIDRLGAVAGLTSLVELDLGENRIEDLSPLAGLTALRVLRADRNRIADLWPLAALAKLDSLDLGSNRVRDLQPLAGMAQLVTLRLAANGLTELYALAGLEGLRALHLAGNAVEDLRALSHLGGLRLLDLRGNVVGDLRPLAALGSLVWLHVGGSRIEDLSPLDGLSGLTVAGRDDLEPPGSAEPDARAGRD